MFRTYCVEILYICCVQCECETIVCLVVEKPATQREPQGNKSCTREELSKLTVSRIDGSTALDPVGSVLPRDCSTSSSLIKVLISTKESIVTRSTWRQGIGAMMPSSSFLGKGPCFGYDG